MQHILAEMIAETADVRADVRVVLWETGKIRAVKSERLAEGQGLEYKDYFDFTESARQIPAHRILALNRGDKENALKVHLDFNADHVREVALRALAQYLQHKPLTMGLARPKPDEPRRRRCGTGYCRYVGCGPCGGTRCSRNCFGTGCYRSAGCGLRGRTSCFRGDTSNRGCRRPGRDRCGSSRGASISACSIRY